MSCVGEACGLQFLHLCNVQCGDSLSLRPEALYADELLGIHLHRLAEFVVASHADEQSGEWGVCQQQQLVVGILSYDALMSGGDLHPESLEV